MSWGRIDDRAPEHRKLVRAGERASWLWVCGLCYCNRQPSRDGFIPIEQVPLLYPFRSSTKPLAKKLVEVGLWEVTANGFMVHDYHDINPTAAQVAEALLKGRQRASRSYRNRVSRNSSIEETPKNTKISSIEEYEESSIESSPFLLDPNQTKPKITATAVTARESQQRSVPCPEDLVLTDGQRRRLEVAMIPGWAIDKITDDFVASAMADPDDKRLLTSWRKCLSKAIAGRWNDPNRRPKRVDDDRRISQADKAAIEAREEALRIQRRDANIARNKQINATAVVAPPAGEQQLAALRKITGHK